MKRIQIIDTFRGITIISMVLFHLFYNINYYCTLGFYDGTLFNRIWQLSIAISFFLISGITSTFLKPKENLKRGLITSLIGFSVTLITYFFAKEQLIIWGVLNGLGLSMIVGGLVQNRISYRIWPIIFITFIFSYKIPQGILENYIVFSHFYEKNLFFLGFPGNSFASSDYFPIIPWTLIFLAGLSLGKYLKIRNYFDFDIKDNIFSKIGRHSLSIYIGHQIILYPLVTLIYKLSL